MKARLAITGPVLEEPLTRGSDRPVTTFTVGLPTKAWDSTAGTRGRMIPAASPQPVTVVAWGRVYAERLPVLRVGDWVRVEGKLAVVRRGGDQHQELTADYIGPAWDQPLPTVEDVFDPTLTEPPF